MLKIVIEQTTKPKKKHYNEIASKIHSEVRDTFFLLRWVSVHCRVSIVQKVWRWWLQRTIAKEGSYAIFTANENCYLSNEFRENLVQYEIREKFWPNTRICFSDEQHHETPYCFTVSDENLSAKIKGKLDHGVKHSKSGFKSLTFEDKAQDAELSDHIAHAVSQVEYEVKRMRKSLLYVPELYIGLLQNGRNWVAILRKVVCGEVLLTYVEAPPAFEVGGTSVSEVNDVNCGYIARLIEHAYCAANQITLEIMNPSMRRKR